jgi:L-asparaginase
MAQPHRDDPSMPNRGDRPESCPYHFPVTHSNLCSRSLSALVAADYDIGTPTGCTLLSHKVNDVYLVRVNEDRYILRAYGARSKFLSEILYELDLLTHLGRKGISVSTPVARKDGSSVRAVNAPEGTRHLVLYTYADGAAPSLDDAESWMLGTKVAELHEAARDFATQHAQSPFDLEHLIDKPLAAIQSSFRVTTEDWEYLQRLAERLRVGVTDLPVERLDWGVCHGDVTGWNCHFDGDTVTFFDFEWCGPGWRAFDLAQFRLWHAPRWAVFLKGYTDVRGFDEAHLAAIPLFIAIRQIWLIGRNTGWGQDWGFGGMNEARFLRTVNGLRNWENGTVDWGGSPISHRGRSTRRPVGEPGGGSGQARETAISSRDAARDAGLPRVHLLTTGGTIGSGKTGDLSADDLATLLPDLSQVTALSVEDFINIGSSLMRPDIQFRLARRVKACLADDPALSGVVITHGTDTLEETAFFLDLLVGSDRPVVFAAAQRSPAEPDSDGPRNLANAIRIAASPHARDMGVLVTLNSEIHAAREVRKAHSVALNAFQSPEAGPIGYIDGDQVVFTRKPLRRLTLSPDSIEPRVEVVTLAAGSDGYLLQAAADHGAQAVVLEVFGRGNVPPPVLEAVKKVRDKGVVVIFTSRTRGGRVILYDVGRDLGVICGEDVDGLKARMLLVAAMGETRDPKTLQAYFEALAVESHLPT